MPVPAVFASFASPLSDAIRRQLEVLHGRVYAHFSTFSKDGGVVTGPEEIGVYPEKTPLIALVLTGGTEKMIMDVTKRHLYPILILAHSSFNSLPATLETIARLKREGYKTRLAYIGSLGEQRLLGAASLAKKILRSMAIRGFRLGLIGGPSEWLVASDVDRDRAYEMLGGEIVEIGMDELVREAGEGCGKRLFAYRERVARRCTASVEAREIDRALSVYCALKRIIEKYRLDGLSLKCFDLIHLIGTTGCLALALLNSEGIIAGCEGDMQSTITMLVARRLTGSEVWMANPVEVDEEENTITLAHCTASLAFPGRCILKTHFESGRGVGVDVGLQGGSVTLVRLSGDLSKLLLLGGEIVASGMGREDLCRTQVRVRLSDGRVGAFLEKAFGNHLVLVNGVHHDVFEAFAHFYGIRVVKAV